MGWMHFGENYTLVSGGNRRGRRVRHGLRAIHWRARNGVRRLYDRVVGSQREPARRSHGGIESLRGSDLR